MLSEASEGGTLVSVLPSHVLSIQGFSSAWIWSKTTKF